jgi:GNAT superfamily N-acetyltransferase
MLSFTREVTDAKSAGYADVCALRRLAHEHDGNAAHSISDSDDEVCRIIVLRRYDVAVGSIRVCLTPDLVRFDNAHLAETALPPLADCVSASRLCLHPDFRHHGLFHMLHAELLIAARETNRRYVVAAVDDELAVLFEREGWRRAGHWMFRVVTDCRSVSHGIE